MVILFGLFILTFAIFYGNSEVIFTIARPIWANDTCWIHKIFFLLQTQQPTQSPRRFHSSSITRSSHDAHITAQSLENWGVVCSRVCFIDHCAEALIKWSASLFLRVRAGRRLSPHNFTHLVKTGYCLQTRSSVILWIRLICTLWVFCILLFLDWWAEELKRPLWSSSTGHLSSHPLLDYSRSPSLSFSGYWHQGCTFHACLNKVKSQ